MEQGGLLGAADGAELGGGETGEVRDERGIAGVEGLEEEGAGGSRLEEAEEVRGEGAKALHNLYLNRSNGRRR